MKKTLLLGLLFTLLCLTVGCGNRTNNGLTPSRDLNPSDDMAGSTLPNDRVLDKGGANGTDNASILDYLQDDDSIPSETPDPYTNRIDESGNIIDDIRDGADDLMNGVKDGIDEMTTPSGSISNDNVTGTNIPR